MRVLNGNTSKTDIDVLLVNLGGVKWVGQSQNNDFSAVGVIVA